MTGVYGCLSGIDRITKFFPFPIVCNSGEKQYTRIPASFPLGETRCGGSGFFTILQKYARKTDYFSKIVQPASLVVSCYQSYSERASFCFGKGFGRTSPFASCRGGTGKRITRAKSCGGAVGNFSRSRFCSDSFAIVQRFTICQCETVWRRRGKNKRSGQNVDRLDESVMEHIARFEMLLGAYYRARRGKREQLRISEFDFLLENELSNLKRQLQSGEYVPQPYTHFTIFDPKTRRVSAPGFRDRVVQQALVATIEPIFEKRFIIDSYACRKGKGTHFGASRVKKFLMASRCVHGKESEMYVLQCDIQKYFQSIDWGILMKIISKTIRTKKVQQLIQTIITTHASAEKISSSADMERSSVCGKGKASEKNVSAQLSLLDLIFDPNDTDILPVSVVKRRGLPIGNLTSQLFANVYLNELDHFVKEVLREKRYARYMDDFLIIHPSKSHLREVQKKLQTFLGETLKLTLHPKKTTIKNVKDGVPFVGYRIFYDHILVRGDTLIRMQRKYRQKKKLFDKKIITAKDLERSRASIYGHLKHANARKLFASSFPSPNQESGTAPVPDPQGFVIL